MHTRSTYFFIWYHAGAHTICVPIYACIFDASIIENLISLSNMIPTMQFNLESSVWHQDTRI